MMITVTRGLPDHHRGGQDRAGCLGLRVGRERREDSAADYRRGRGRRQRSAGE
jgi:hypothetical protein